MCDKAISENGGTLKSAPWAHQKVFSPWNYKLGWFQYPFIFAMINSCRKQSDAFERSVSSTPNALPLSTDNFHFSNIANTQLGH